MFDKPAQSSQPLIDAISLRWSGRVYDPDRPVARADLVATLEAARWAPSCFGDQPWRIMVWDRFADMDSWRTAFDLLVEGNQGWARSAPVLGLACADGLFSLNEKPNRWAQYDTGAAMVSLAIQATSLGLMVHQMGGFDAEGVSNTFDIPERYTPMAMFTVGYQLPESRMDAEALEREKQPRERRPLSDLFFENAWTSAVNQG